MSYSRSPVDFRDRPMCGRTFFSTQSRMKLRLSPQPNFAMDALTPTRPIQVRTSSFPGRLVAAPCRIEFVICGLHVRLLLLSISPHDDAVSFGYRGQASPSALAASREHEFCRGFQTPLRVIPGSRINNTFHRSNTTPCSTLRIRLTARWRRSGTLLP